MIKDTNSTPSSNVTESEAFRKFKELLEEIFELDKSDLDFGIYRILNIRNDKIKEFLSNDLPNKVKDALSSFNDPNYNMIALESDVYSALYTFFSRYYDEGDFISKRRYKEGVYAIPYEGEEVKLYWANQDQYYVKTSENFKDYTFKADDYLIHFRIVDATTEQNNNKESDDNTRVFMLFTEDEENFPGIKTMEYNSEKKEITIRFIYEIQNKYTGKADTIIQKWNEDNFESIKEWLVNEQIPTWDTLLKSKEHKKDKKYCLLKKHLNAYVAKNTFDYFIHKDLKGFLTRELDFYIKSEIMHLDDLDTDNEQRVETYLGQIKAIKRVGNIIIDFLAQIENFQKKLWLKKKFVIETNWCITLDRIDEKFYHEIIENKAQIQEWIDMYAVDEIKEDLTTVGFTNPPTAEFLKQNDKLIVDTKHFSSDFKERLIASIDNLDEQTGGLLINSDNFHALNLLQNRYEHSINCVYIDPPYNAQSSEILYKNTFKHSSWLSLMQNRIIESKKMLKNDAVYICAIDEVEQERLGLLFSEIFDMNYFGKTCVTIVHNPSGQQGDNFSATHEYAFFLYPIPGRSIAEQERDNPDEWDKRNLRDVTGDSSLRSAGKTCFYPILIKDDKVIGFGDIAPNDYHPPVNVIRDDGIIEVYPVDPQGIERKWRFGRDTVEQIQDQLIVNYISNRNVYDIQRLKKSFNYKTVWQSAKYSANNYGTQVLNPMFGFQPFSYPKSIFTVQECILASMNEKRKGIILDFFAGSGTTAHSVLLTNKQQSKDLKYILVEMGSYFDTATLKRVKKSIYCVDTKGWKNGKPQNRNTGVSHIMKYMKLESYEDALSNITLNDIDEIPSLLGDDYLINYMLDIESEDSILNLDAFNHPFEYKLKITENNEIKEKKIDIVETFNYLIGLTVQKSSVISFFNAVEDKNGEYEGAVQLIEDINGTYNFKHVTGTTPDGKRVLIIWRTISDNLIESNAALDAYFIKYYKDTQNGGYDIIYVNGDNNLQNISIEEGGFKVLMTEIEFKKRMFEEE